MPIERIRARLQEAIDRRYKRVLPSFDDIVGEEGEKTGREDKARKVDVDPAYKSAGSGLSMERVKATLARAVDEVLEEEREEHVEKALDEYLDVNMDGLVASFLRAEFERACEEYLGGEKEAL